MFGPLICMLAVALCLTQWTAALPAGQLAEWMRRQAPNQLYVSDPASQTGSFNMTAWVLPIPIATAQSLIGTTSYGLISNHGLDSSVIPSGYHPLLVVPGYFFDIRQKELGLLPLQVEQLSVVEVFLPFVDVLGTGKAFRRSVVTYMDQIIPALVGGAKEFHNAQLAYFDPEHAAYRSAGGSSLSFRAAQGIVNTVDGPGLVSPLFQSLHSRTASSAISESQFQAMLNMPYYTTPGFGCNKAKLYFNYPDADPSFVTGDAQVYSPILPSTSDYPSAVGYSAAT
ncbi:hypothetical protein BCV70DRAFT_58595 [Testicularia cyperi]|uniref:Uncharacterized protein n=1 Tax=Testicularia cyperi TaxID=1882483 RepID=A0A317XW87_9BASI|nr:hypothetical protein BCV70DRAFT_58595 [Testicularia cyperi]